MDSRLSHQQLHLLSAETVSALCFNQSVHPRRVLIALCLAELLAMTMWFTGAIALRFLTGAALAGVYPVSMKLIASWFREGRGFALGARAVTLTSSALAVLAAVIVFAFVNVGPYHAPVEFRLSACTEFLRNRQLLLANLGYLGHMWRLYSM
ncbi:MAG: hypothetical protein ABI383_07240 [Acidobacteriaceae bacterium]